MYSFRVNHRIIATYGVGSGNAPAPQYFERRTPTSGFYLFPKSKYHGQLGKCTRTGVRRC